MIGTENPTFLSGQTDLRGVFVAEGVRGQVTAVARRDAAQYAFYRGTTRVGAPPAAPTPPARGQPSQARRARPRSRTQRLRPRQEHQDAELLQLDAADPAAREPLQGQPQGDQRPGGEVTPVGSAMPDHPPGGPATATGSLVRDRRTLQGLQIRIEVGQLLLRSAPRSRPAGMREVVPGPSRGDRRAVHPLDRRRGRSGRSALRPTRRRGCR